MLNVDVCTQVKLVSLISDSISISQTSKTPNYSSSQKERSLVHFYINNELKRKRIREQAHSTAVLCS